MRPIQSTSAVLWLLAAMTYFVAEAVSALAFPGYSYATNYISDLGIPGIEMFQGRAINSPLHLVMNITFCLHGVLFAMAAAITVRDASWRRGARRWFVGLALAHALGMVLVGLFPGSQTNTDNGLIFLHVLGAAIAITAGNAAVLVVGFSLLGNGGRWQGYTSIAFGVAGLLGLVMLLVDSNWATFNLLPDGIWERIAVYAILVWELLVGFVALATRNRVSAVRP